VTDTGVFADENHHKSYQYPSLQQAVTFQDTRSLLHAADTATQSRKSLCESRTGTWLNANRNRRKPQHCASRFLFSTTSATRTTSHGPLPFRILWTNDRWG